MPGDVYLLCSDGLSDMLDDETIAQLLQSCELLPEAAQRPDRRGQRGRRKG